jgi:membrane-bound lytic murein transglycosylase D
MAAVVDARLAEAGPATFARFERYATRRGETMVTIARKFKVTTTDLASANGLTTQSRLKVGQSLMIPRAVSAALASRPAEAPAPAAATKLTYRVKSGDTLTGIARQFDTTVSDIKRWNSLTSNRIDVGDRLTIHRNN